MRITIVTEYLGAHGGTEEYVRAVGQCLVARSHRVELLYERVGEFEDVGWARFLASVPAEPLPATAAERARVLGGHLRTARPDLFFVQNLSRVEVLGELAQLGVPVVRFIHDFRPVCLRTSKVFPISRRNCSRPLGPGCLLHACFVGPGRGDSRLPIRWNSLSRKLQERQTCRRLDRVIVASGFMRRLLLANGFRPERTLCIPLFCSLPIPERPPELKRSDVLLYLGQVERFKGLALLLEALRALPSRLSLRVAGDGAWRGRCERLARAWGLGRRVEFLGWQERDRLPAILEEVGALVVPSVWNEPFGLVGLEAMAYGRPVIAFDVGGIREWLRDNECGILVRDTRAGALARAILALCSDPERARRLGIRGHEWVRQKFTLSRHVDQLLTEFGAVANGRGGRWAPVMSA